MVKDLTTGSPAKRIVLLTIPMMLGNLFQQLYNMADTLIVGRTIGVQALAAVGCTGSIIWLIIGLAQTITYGFSLVTAQHFGAHDAARVRRSFATSLIISMTLAILLTLVSVPMTTTILKWMHTPPEILQQAHHYLIVMFGGIAASVLFNLFFNMIRALGDGKTPLLFLGITCLLNIALDFLFILWFNMGVMGAGLATVISQAVSSILCIFYIKRKLPGLQLQKEDWRITPQDVKVHLKVGLPVGFQNSIIVIGALALQIAFNQLGAQAVTAYTVQAKIGSFATLPLNAFGTSMATYAAQNYGACNLERIRRGVRQCMAMTIPLALLLSIAIILAGRPLAWIFLGSGEEAVFALVQKYLRMVCPFYFGLQALLVYRGVLQGLGKGLVPTIAGVMELVGRFVGALVLARIYGFAGACIAEPAAWLGAAVPVVISYYYTMRELRWRMQVGKNAVLLLPGNIAACAEKTMIEEQNSREKAMDNEPAENREYIPCCENVQGNISEIEAT